MLYVEKAVEGDGGGNGGRGGSGRVFRRRHEEERVEREWEERRQKKMENIYEKIERQFKEEEVGKRKRIRSLTFFCDVVIHKCNNKYVHLIIKSIYISLLFFRSSIKTEEEKIE